MEAHFKLKEPNGEGKTLIYLKSYYRGKRFTYSTGIKVEPKNWLISSERCKQGREFREGKIINAKLEHMSNVLKNIFLAVNYPNLTVPELKKAFINELNGTKEETSEITFIEYFKQHKDRHIEKYSIDSGKRFLTAINHLEKFFKYKGREYGWNDINVSFAEEFESYLYSNKNIKSSNYVGKVFTGIKTVMKSAYEKELHNNKRYEQIKVENIEVYNIYLTEDEIDRIYKLEVLQKGEINPPEGKGQQKLEKGEDRVRDAFLIGCYTGLRSNDVKRLTKEHFKEKTIIMVTSKTQEPVVIPIHPRVKKIMEKYQWVLPTLYKNAVLNRYLKEIAKKANIKEQVLLSKVEKRKKVDEVIVKHKLVTTHTARRSFVTNLLLNGLYPLQIMKMTGHKTEKAFLKYVKMTSEQNALMVQENAFFKE